MPDDKVDTVIDSGLPESERAYMHGVLLSMPPTSRWDVAYYAADGSRHSNRVATLAKMDRAQIVAPDGSVSRADGSKRYAPERLATSVTSVSGSRHPLDFAQPPPTDATGPFRRVYSDPYYNVERTQVDIPCNASRYVPPNRDTGYVYVGAFGLNGSALDAGLFSEIEGDGSFNIFLQWTTRDRVFHYANARQTIDCGQNVGLVLYILNNGAAPSTGFAQTDFILDILARHDNGQTSAQTIRSSVYNLDAGDWPKNGFGVRLKRMTSIAQGANNFTSGSTFGIDINGQPQIFWNQASYAAGCGFSCSSYPVWSGGGGQDFPRPEDGWASQSRVRYNYYAPDQEVDGINLS